ncbi:MAG: hypothetical protein J2P17_30150, partial [Mycobacterium sp.]|nr:hypothetical protein [Mycobacterium sp.]
TDALGDNPVAAYTDSVRRCTKAFTRPGILDTILDYPLGRVPGRQALAVRATDSVIHTWDLARAIGGNEIPDTGLITWIDGNLAEIYAGLVETPTSAETTHQFFAAPTATPDDHASTQDRLLIRFGRQP